MLLGIVLFVLLVVVHEWGHFIAARRNGVEVEEFGIGFPPKIWGKNVKTEKSEFLFSLNLLPLGGFVKLKGETDSDKRPGSFGAASLKAKIKIMLAGVAMNVVVAYLAFTALALFGMPTLIENQFTVKNDTKIIQEVKNKDSVLVASVVSSSPAQKSGLEKGDQIVSINDQSISSPEQVSQITEKNAGKEISLTVNRSDQEKFLKAKLNEKNEGQGFLGVSSASGQSGLELRRSTWSAPIVGAGVIAQFSQQTYSGLAKAITNLVKGQGAKASEQVTGPVGIVVILKEGSKLGINFVIMFIAIISLVLALINVLPIPALDGGRLFVTLLFRAIKKPLTKSKEELIHGLGMMCLLGLFVLITFVDIKRFF